MAGADAGGGESAYRARVGYVSDYLYGFNPNSDRDGYAITDESGSADKEQRFFGMWIPGQQKEHMCSTLANSREAACADYFYVSACCLRQKSLLADLCDVERKQETV